MTRFVPSAAMAVISPEAISTTATEPSGITTGPSGKRRPVASVVRSGVMVTVMAVPPLCFGGIMAQR